MFSWQIQVDPSRSLRIQVHLQSQHWRDRDRRVPRAWWTANLAKQSNFRLRGGGRDGDGDRELMHENTHAHTFIIVTKWKKMKTKKPHCACCFHSLNFLSLSELWGSCLPLFNYVHPTPWTWSHDSLHMRYAFGRPQKYVCVIIFFLNKILKTNQKRQKWDGKVGKLLTLLEEQRLRVYVIYLWGVHTWFTYISMQLIQCGWILLHSSLYSHNLSNSF